MKTLEEDSLNLSRPSWDDTWMKVAETVAERSLCDRAKVGCVVVSDNQSVLAVSYNGPPPGFPTAGTCKNWCPRACGVGGVTSDYSNCPAVHAEVNAIARSDHSRLSGATVYSTRASCINCAKSIAASGIVRLVHKVDKTDMHRDPDGTEEFLRSCGVEVVRLP